MIGYGGDVNAQRDAITQALVNNVMPEPRTPMPAPNASAAAAMAMPGRQPPGLANQSRIAPTPLGQPQPAPAAPLPPMGMQPTPASGMPFGPQPGGLPGQMPLVQQPSQQLMPQGTQPGSY